jgi:hypothetical protein
MPIILQLNSCPLLIINVCTPKRDSWLRGEIAFNSSLLCRQKKNATKAYNPNAGGGGGRKGYNMITLLIKSNVANLKRKFVDFTVASSLLSTKKRRMMPL